MIVYCLIPIDFWQGWHRPSALFRVADDIINDGIHDPDDWKRQWELAQAIATDMGWEGDIREGPYVTVIPDQPGNYSDPPILIAWKQDNNGTTFIASPFRLPWLEDESTTWRARNR